MDREKQSMKAFTEDELNKLSWKIIGACIEVHRFLGPGLLESIYSDCLSREFSLRNISFKREVFVPLMYKGEVFSTKLRADYVVEDSVILELKSVREMLPIYEAQLMSYMALSNIELGLLINFNVSLLKEGIIRMRLNHGKLTEHDQSLLMQSKPQL